MFPASKVTVWLYQKPVDMRCSFDGLAVIVKNRLLKVANSGDWYVFVNRKRTLMKILYYQSGGFCVWAKRLEQGRFQPVVGRDDQLRLDTTQLQCLIDGINWQKIPQYKRFQGSLML